MAALVAAHARETFGEVAALHERVDHFRDHPAQHAVARLIVAWVRGCEVIKVRVKALPQRGLNPNLSENHSMATLGELTVTRDFTTLNSLVNIVGLFSCEVWFVEGNRFHFFKSSL